jgi:deoxyribodipyrimidine photo-lyase
VLVYVFDPADYAQTRYGWSKTGSYRTHFLLEALEDFRKQAQDLGGALLLRTGDTPKVLAALAKEVGASTLYATGYGTPEETAREEAVCKAIDAQGCTLILSFGHTLYDPSDLPFPLERLPDIFTNFRKAVEGRVDVLAPLPKPKALQNLPLGLQEGAIPTLDELGISPLQTHPLADYRVNGGETAAEAHWEEYLAERHLSSYKETRNGLLGMHYSSKLSAWLALGCISPRRIYDDVKTYEQNVTANESTYWLVFELLWRDYFFFVAQKFGSKLFLKGGIRETGDEDLGRDTDALEAWTKGQTGIPFIDANMRQLAATGFMSNRGRQNVASFWVKDLKQDWRIGASYFEHMLVDYDPASNWGNWCYVAGVGNDPRPNRYFNILKQAYQYDPQGAFVRHYVPEVATLPNAFVHIPHTLPAAECSRLGFTMGKSYPMPIVDLPVYKTD